MPFKVMDHWYTPEEVLANPNEYYIFGDNEKRVGSGGQAKIRNCPNAIGIRTKGGPGTDESCYWDQKTRDVGVLIDLVREDFENKVVPLLIEGKTVWWPKDDIGTGLAQLRTRALPVLWYIFGWRDGLLMRFSSNV